MTSTQAAVSKPFSADSHICEPPNCYVDYIDPRYREDAPKVIRDASGVDMYWMKHDDFLIPMGVIAAAGREPREIGVKNITYDEMYPGGWDPVQRLKDQDADGVCGEVVYPSVGMVLCDNPDPNYKSACMWAYNRWLQEFVAYEPDRLVGIGQTAVRSVAEAIEDFRRIKEMGFKGVMLPARPATAFDYDDPLFDSLWSAAIELDLPISFHILTSRKDLETRGPKINFWSGTMRGVQDIIGMFIFSGIFSRFPALKLVCVEGDAGWVPHYTYRLDHIYKRHRHANKGIELAKLPSEQFYENVYLTFQDDWVAFQTLGLMNHKRLMWANDFPHADATWPHSQALLVEHASEVDPAKKSRVLRDNVIELYRLNDPEAGVAGGAREERAPVMA